MAALSYNATVVVIIAGAVAAVLLGFAVWRLCFWDPRDGSYNLDAYEASNEQKEYMYQVRDRNRLALLESNGIRGGH